MNGRSLHLDGVALWTPRLPGWEHARAVLRGEAAPAPEPAKRPAPALLAPTERRRAPDTVAIALEVAAKACEHAGVDPAALPSVFASTHGDLAISDYMCATLAQSPALISPTRFHNSVHNAAAGYWTIGTGAMTPSTALSAHRHTFAQGLLEAALQVACDDTPVLLVAYDIEAQGPMATVCDSRGLFGAALVLSPARSERSIAVLHWHLDNEAAPPLPDDLAALDDGNPLAGSLALFAAIARGDDARVALSAGPASSLVVGIAPA